MILGSGPKLVPVLIFSNLWTLGLLFLASNHISQYEPLQNARDVDHSLFVPPERPPARINGNGNGGDVTEDLPSLVHHTPGSGSNEAHKDDRVNVSTQPVGPTRDPNLPAFCPECGPGDLLCAKYGKYTIARSVAYGGASARLLRVLENAREGKPTKIGVLGGSVSDGHGIKPEQNWIALFENWWKTTFPKSETSLTNGAVPATGSDYFAMCFAEHINKDVDLIILEVAINDQRYDIFAEANEWLLRALLDLPTKPAILNLQTMALMFDKITTGGDLHNALMNYYDVPSVSIRNPLLPQILAHPEVVEKWFAHDEQGKVDLRHVGAAGHQMMADLLIHFVQTRICTLYDPLWLAPPSLALVADQDGGNSLVKPEDMMGPDGLEDVPRQRLFEKYDPIKVQEQIDPYCMTITSKRHYLTPWKNSGWEYWTWESPTNPRNKKPYLRAAEPGAFVTFKVRVGAMGRVRVTFLKAGSYGLGKAWCWVGALPPVKLKEGADWKWEGWDVDRSKGRMLNAFWKLEINVATTDVIQSGVSPGEHLLHCEVMKETDDPSGSHEMRLIAVDAA